MLKQIESEYGFTAFHERLAELLQIHLHCTQWVRHSFASDVQIHVGQHRPGYQLWDYPTVVRNLFLAEESGKSKVPTHISYEEWNCTALFQATIYARSFAAPDSKGHYKTLDELYVRHHKVPPGKFHPSVVSSSGNAAETLALAIDQLRLLQNSPCQYVQLPKEAFKEGRTSTPNCEGFFQKPIWLYSFWASLEETPQEIKFLSRCP